MDADVIALQEVSNRPALEYLLSLDPIKGKYDIHPISDNWRGEQVVIIAKKHMVLKGKKVHTDVPPNCRLSRTIKGESGEDYRVSVEVDSFTRPVLQVTLQNSNFPDSKEIDFFVVHLKSRHPMSLDRQDSRNPDISKHRFALGKALSGIRRLSEAAGVKVLVSENMQTSDNPHIVLGDFNDVQSSDVLTVISGSPDIRCASCSRSDDDSRRKKEVSTHLS